MNNKFEDKLNTILKRDSRFLDQEGNFLTNTIIDSAYKIDNKLIELLISDKEIKDKFFTKIKDIYVFNINDFVSYIQDKNFLNDSYTKFKNKIGLNIGSKFLNERKEVSLVWPFKDCVLEGGMTKEDEKKKEIFFNEILAEDDIDKLLAPKVLTNWKRYTKNGSEKVKELKRDKDGTIRENFVIKGNNLLALHSLKEQFAGQIKLIYIDPPYNTEGDADTFTYNNNFKHSSWLTFIKNRFEVAKELLKEDGFVAITIDHFELFYLGALADEIFGRENRLGIVSVVIRPQGRQFAKFFSATTEYMLVYAKNERIAKFNGVVLDEDKMKEYIEFDDQGAFKYEPLMYSRFVKEKLEKGDKYYYPIYVSNDLSEITLEAKQGYIKVLPINKKRKIAWRVQKDKFKALLIEKPDDFTAIKDKHNNVQIYEKYREEDGTKIKTHWIGKRYNATTSGTGVLKEIFGEKVFSYPKSLYAVLDTIKIMTNKDDIILDFFAGSGTTAHAVLELNKEDQGERNFILVEQMDYVESVIIPRIQKVIKKENIDTNFLYCELKKYNEQFIEDIGKAKDSKILLKIWKEMKEKAFFNYNADLKIFEENMKEFEKLSLNKQKDVLISLLNKNQLYVNLSEIEDKDFKVIKEDKELNKEFYG